jgi:ribonuclease Z
MHRQLRGALRVGAAALLVAHSHSHIAQAQRRFTSQQLCSAAQRARGCLIVLGSGMPVPDPTRAGPAYAVAFQNRTFVFDAGSGVMRRIAAAGLPIDEVTRLFLTHLHSDHTLGLPDVMLTTWVMGRKTALGIVGPPGTLHMTDAILSAWADDVRVRTEGLEHGQRDGQRVDVSETRGGVVYDSAGVRITAVKVPHGDWDTALAYVVETPTRKLVLSGDTAPSDALFAAARGADVLVHETYPAVRLHPENRPGGEEWPHYMQTFHTSDQEIGTLAAAHNIKRVVLSHVVWMGGTPAELLAGVRRGGFTGPTHVARDLEVY